MRGTSRSGAPFSPLTSVAYVAGLFKRIGEVRWRLTSLTKSRPRKLSSWTFALSFSRHARATLQSLHEKHETENLTVSLSYSSSCFAQIYAMPPRPRALTGSPWKTSLPPGAFPSSPLPPPHIVCHPSLSGREVWGGRVGQMTWGNGSCGGASATKHMRNRRASL